MNNLMNQILLLNTGTEDLGACLKANDHLDPVAALDACAERGRKAVKERMLLELIGIACLALGALLVVAIATGFHAPSMF